jgi:two-component sensor histidine kinase
LLRIEWTERDGPPVVAPKRHGFGTRFIEGSVASELQGKATLDFAAAGLRCTMDIPLDSATPHVEADSQAAPPR